jgi:hypothetical protein
MTVNNLLAGISGTLCDLSFHRSRYGRRFYFGMRLTHRILAADFLRRRAIAEPYP